MQISGATAEQISSAMVMAKVCWRGGIASDRVRIVTDSKTGSPPKWRKIGYHGRTVPGAVCWHGHRAFMRELFKLAPETVIRTGLATYKGSQHFEDTHEATRYARGKPGAFMEGAAVQPCDCGD